MSRPLVHKGGAPLFLLAYFFSGAAALGYEVLWARWLSLQFGVSNIGVLLAVFAFLLGLGGGAYWALGRQWDVRRSLRLFWLMESGVALYMASLPFFAEALSSPLGEWAPGLSPMAWWSVEAVAAVVLLTLPSLALGFVFTALVRGLASQGMALSRLYGVNTLGGVVGGLLPLLLLPAVGWSHSLWFMAGLGMVAALLAYASSRSISSGVDARDASGHAVSRHALGWYALVGMGAIMLEIAWARLFGLVFLRTEYVMGIILAAYLIGVGAGSLAAGRREAGRWVKWIPLLVAVSAGGSLLALGWVGDWVESWEPGSLWSAVLWQMVVLLLLMLPATFALGLWLPVLAERMGGGPRSGPALYAVNSLGGALGALAAGLLVIPLWGTAAALVLAIWILVGAGAVLSGSRRAWLLALPAALVVVPLWDTPEPKALLPGSYGETETLLAYEDATSITHVIAEPSGQRLLLSDLQRMDASTEPEAVAGQRNQVRLGLLLHPRPERVLLLGLGTGISASAVRALPEVEVTAVELSQGAIEAARRLFDRANLGVVGDMRVVRDDARHFLLAERRLYDVIVGDLFHPDLVGRSALLSVQQFRRARERLAEGGVFVQWLTLNQFDLQSLQVVLRSFARVFPDGRLFLDGFRLALVGYQGRWAPDEALGAHESGLGPSRFAFLTGGEGRWTWLGRYFGTLSRLPPGPVQDEWAPQLEFQLPRARYAGGIDVPANAKWLLHRRPSVEEAAEALGVDAAGPFARAYRASAWGLRGFVAALEGDPQSDRYLRMAYESNPQDRWVASAYAQRLLDTLPQALARGMDETAAVDRILAVRADFVPALRRRYELALKAGEGQTAREIAARIRALDPYGRLALPAGD